MSANITNEVIDVLSRLGLLKSNNSGGVAPAAVGGASDTVLYSAVVQLNADTVVNLNEIIPFDTVVRDDNSMWDAASKSLLLPPGFTQFRFGYQLVFTSGGNGTATYRKCTPNILIANTGEVEGDLGVLPAVIHTPTFTLSAGAQTLTASYSTQKLTMEYVSPLIDVSQLINVPSNIAGEDAVYLQLAHNGGTGVVSLATDSVFWLEAYAPTPV